MKKAIVVLLFTFVLNSAACGLFAPMEIEPVFTPLSPTMTPDLCVPEILGDEMETIRADLIEFREATLLADDARNDEVADALEQLEEIRVRLLGLATPPCLAPFKQSYKDYTAMVTRYLESRVENPYKDDYKEDQRASEMLWQVVVKEYERALFTVGLEYQTLNAPAAAD